MPLGYTPFSFDITDVVKRGEENELVVVVWDPTNGETSCQQRGKQTLKPAFINYTASSGIWQTVWMESVAERRIERTLTHANITKGTALVDVTTTDNCDGLTIEVILKDDNSSFKAEAGQPVLVKPAELKLWIPENPNLYDIKVRLLDGDKVIDEADSYFAMRDLGLDHNGGSPLLTLNNKPIFHNGPLDQGYWPDGIYTAPTDAALQFDIELAKSYGYNMLRKHIKIEPARWYHHCDKLGILVWQDMISGGTPIPPKDGWVDYLQHVAPLGIDHHHDIPDRDYEGWGRTEENKAQFINEYTEMVQSLQMFPSLAVWIPFNEYWGQFDTVRITEMTRKLDPTRLINSASGFFDQGSGDIYDMHIYRRKIERVEDPRHFRAGVLGEYGGQTWAVEDHMWSDKTFGYGKTEGQADYQAAYTDMMANEIKVAIENGLAGAVYTQLTDVEIEINGVVTYDREISKIAPEEMTRIHNELYEAFEKRNG